MFNSSLKKQKINTLENYIKQYNIVIEDTKANNEKLLDIRIKAVKLIGIIERYINTIANTPKSFEKDFKEINMIVNSFNDDLLNIKKESKMIDISNISLASAGLVTSLTGVKLNSILFTLAGPVGAAISGLTMASGGLIASKKNKEIAEEAENKSIEIKKLTSKYECINYNLLKLHDSTVNHGKVINKIYERLLKTSKRDFNKFTLDEQHDLGVLVNDTKAFAKLINKNVSV